MSRQQLHITLAGREHVVDAGTTAADALENGSRRGTPRRTVIAARVNGELRDLATPLADGDEVAGVEIASDDGRAILRHSTAHVMAQAVQELFPEAKLGIGPPVEAGFYYDFDVAQPFGPDDLKTSRHACARSSSRASGSPGGPSATSRPARNWPGAVQAGADRPQGRRPGRERRRGRTDRPLRGQRRGGGRGRRRQLTIYDNLDPAHRRAVLEGPVPRAAPAHHPGHPGVQADAHRRRVLAGQREEPAAAADLRHRVGIPPGAGRLPAPAGRGGATRPPQARRRAGPVLVPDGDRLRAAGVPPQGRIIRRVMEDYSRRRHEEAGYEYVNTPHITKEELFETSGHLGFYAESMFPPMEIGGRQVLPQADELPVARADLSSRAGGRTGSCRCGCSSSAPCTGTRSPAWCTG